MKRKYVRGDAPEQLLRNQPHGSEHIHNLDQPLHENDHPESELTSDAWKRRDYNSADADVEAERSERRHQLDGFAEERDVWGTDSHYHNGTER
jgi:hypothetical protein